MPDLKRDFQRAVGIESYCMFITCIHTYLTYDGQIRVQQRLQRWQNTKHTKRDQHSFSGRACNVGFNNLNFTLAAIAVSKNSFFSDFGNSELMPKVLTRKAILSSKLCHPGTCTYSLLYVRRL